MRHDRFLVRWALAAALLAGCASWSAAGAATWGVIEHDGAGRPVGPYLSSLAGGERAIGAIRSRTFTLDADTVSFEICGHDGPPGDRRYRSWFALCEAETGLALRRVSPPAQDAMTVVQWDVVELIGRKVYLRAVDGVAEPAFAWMGIRNVRVGDQDLTGALTPGHLPDGWTEETQPAGVAVDEWLRCRPASAHWALEMEPTAPTWGVSNVDREGHPCSPFLVSLGGGEPGIGAVRSPDFTLDTPTYSLLVAGVDSPTGNAGLNSFQLVDAKTLEILRQSEPPMSNPLRPLAWDTKDLVGRRVFFRAVDGNDSSGWAWLGCDQVPLGGGRVVRFAEANALAGWREEGQPEGSLTGAARPPQTRQEQIEAEWLTEDVRCGVRWSLWEENHSAAPYLLRRLVRLMEADFARADRLLRDFARGGAPAKALAPFPPRLARLRERLAALEGEPLNVSAWQTLRREQRAVLRELAFRNPALACDRLLFVKRFTQQSYSDINVNHHAWGSRPGGDLFVLTGFRPGEAVEASGLINGRLGPGNIHGIDLDWDASRIVFAYARSASDQPPDGWLSRQATFELHRTVGLLHLYEMAADGSGLRQLTEGQWSDLNPCYLPRGDIAFESERGGYELDCNECDKDEPTTNLYALHRNNGEIQRLATTKDGDWYPRVLPDGSLIYSHWEYHERSLMFIHSLWAIHPDGTGADNFVKQHFNFPLALTVPRPVPGSDKVIAIAAGHHTLAAGPVVLVDRSVGMNDPGCLQRLTGPDTWPEAGGAAPGPSVPGWHLAPGQGWYMDPYPLSETTYLAAYCDGTMTDEAGYGLYLMDVYGGKELIYRDPAISCVMPVPLRPRPRPPILPAVNAPSPPEATCIVTDVASGVGELAPGAVRFLRIAEPVPWPYDNEIGGQRYEPDAKATGVNWTPVRILGTVPVEPDGSAYFRVPADTCLYFQALDAEGMELRRMRSFLSFRPGEVRSCTGCHETRGEAPPPPAGAPLALRRAPASPVPPPWGTRPLSFLRDIQPVLNRCCVRCHSGLKPSGNLDLSPGLTQDHNRAYDSLLDPGRHLVAVSSKGDDARVTEVLAFGAHRSRLIEVLRTAHHDRCPLSEDEWQRLYTWLDANAVYHDDFIRKRPASATPYSLVEDQALWQKIGAIHERRCASCHSGQALSRPEWVDLNDPARSIFLQAPLAGGKTANGKRCAPAVYTTTSDPDYVSVLSLLQEAVRKSWEHPRRDLICLAQDPALRGAVFAGVSLPDEAQR